MLQIWNGLDDVWAHDVDILDTIVGLLGTLTCDWSLVDRSARGKSSLPWFHDSAKYYVLAW